MTTSTIRRRVAIPAAAAAVALALAACGDNNGNGDTEPATDGDTNTEDTNGDNGDDAAAGGRLAGLQEAGTITVGFAGEAPYSFQQDGELVGASVALQERIWGELGIENVEGVETQWNQLIPGLNAGHFDVVAAGMSILPERCEQAIFSDPEFQYTTALMVEEGNPFDVHDMQDILEAQESEGLRMAAMSGAIEATYAADLGIEATEVGGPQDGMDQVTGGRADVFALTGISLNWMVDNATDPGVEVTDSFVAVVNDVEQFGAGGTVFRPEDTELRDAYNEKLAEIVSTEESYLDLVGDWGFTEGERPTGDFTTEQLCAGEIG